MNQLGRRNLKAFGAATLAAGVATLLYEAWRGDLQVHDSLHALAVALPVAALVQIARPVLERRVRRVTFRTALLTKSAVFAAIFAAGLFAGVWAEKRLGWSNLGSKVSLPEIILFAFAATTVTTFLTELDRRLGPGVLLNWLLGKYHAPRREERVFLFVDVKGSTSHAERLGDLRFSAFLRDFFSDIARPVLEYSGEVSHYVGDEAVISWPLSKGVDDASCLRCFFRIVDELSQRASWYSAEYGAVPEVKAAIHCGAVVLTEVGEIKTDLVFHGDTLNTASRIQALCRQLAADLLVSARLIRQIQLPPGCDAVDLGPQSLRGKERDVRVFSVTRSGRRSFHETEPEAAQGTSTVPAP